MCQALLAELLPRVAPELLGGLPAWRALAQVLWDGAGDSFGMVVVLHFSNITKHIVMIKKDEYGEYSHGFIYF